MSPVEDFPQNAPSGSSVLVRVSEGAGGGAAAVRTFDYGDAVRVRAEFFDPDTRLPVTPVGVELLVSEPDGQVSETIPMTELVLASGVFVALYVPEGPGTHAYRVTSANPPAVAERRFHVRSRLLPPDLVTTEGGDTLVTEA